ncbi:DNA-binding protein [Aestuariibaculum lutulentum]|uniref:DNA-binding protein n=1 Tax=Aestuariibaculum lutulentum TaxID=2920935 RepID=A0ABS9RIR6_9FLAO|nr:DNA-binding protein [Aestuariibaculum lutulentum]MCH4551997.1 DNA-binding protein [Aestuariibaculum lutulentum]
MKKKAILFQGLSIEELQELIGTIVTKNVAELQHELQSKKITGELRTQEETCNFLWVDSSILCAWTNKGKVKDYGIGARLYYMCCDLLECLTFLKKVRHDNI